MVDSWWAMAGVAILMFGVFFAAHFVAAVFVDMTSDTETLGKPAGSDIVQGKRTLIAIHALESGANLPTFRKLFGTESDNLTDLSIAVEELRDNGSIQYALDRALEHHKIAHDCLDKLNQSQAVDLLRDMTDFQLVRIN